MLFFFDVVALFLALFKAEFFAFIAGEKSAQSAVPGVCQLVNPDGL